MSNPLDKKVSTSWILIIVGFFCCFILTIVGTVIAYDAKKQGHPGANAPFMVGVVLIVLSIIAWPIMFATGMLATFLPGGATP